MAQQGEVPSDSEVQSQLDRILASAHFNNASTQSKILRFVIEKRMANQPIKEVDITDLISDRFTIKSHKARANATIIRSKLARYYEGEGSDDLVRISLPPGPSYRPEFSYHAQAEVLRAYKRALANKARATNNSLSVAWSDLWKIAELAPDFAPSYTARAEIDLLKAIRKAFFWIGPRFRMGLSSYIQEARKLSPQSAQVHIIMGAEFLFASDLNRSREAFDTALRIDKKLTEASLWYATYLLTLGDSETALGIVEASVKENPENTAIRLLYALFLYLARRLEEAGDVLMDIPDEQEHEEYRQLLKGFVFVECSTLGAELALDIFSELSPMSDKDWNNERHLYEFSEKPERFPGLVVLALARGKRLNDARAKMTYMEEYSPYIPFQFAVGFTAVGSVGRALVILRDCCRRGDLFVNWLDLLPVFDSIRGHPRFRHLVKAMSEGVYP